jgi:lipopolysaccharide transport system ATP-binding protein
MSDIAIQIEGLGKKYTLRHERAGYKTFRETLVSGAQAIARRMRHPFSTRSSEDAEEFWALQDVNLEIRQGERIGIIGRNGAGKSTLLKILSRITEPTTGRVIINGRVASLLEVGTGFHPELTGRENIYLNGAILGMKRSEIKRKFDEIVDFSGVERFIDTPVKHYSSGMYVRLAFSVAAHLEPEILVVDEVLAVGDAGFQKKCLGKMGEVSKEGRTILFVSHNMNAIEQLCDKAILLENGSISFASDIVSTVIHKYFSGDGDRYGCSWQRENNRFDNKYFKPLAMRIVDQDGAIPQMPISNNKDYFIEIEAEIEILDPALTIGYCLYTEDSQMLYWSYQTDTDEKKWPNLIEAKNVLRSRLPKRLLNEGTYQIELIGGLHFVKWLFEPRKNNPKISIEIQGGLSDSPYMIHKRPTLLSPIFKWKRLDV